MAVLQQRYNESFANPAELISGPEYVDKTLRYHHREGFPYFLLPDPQAGSVYYNNHAFGNQQLAYDVVLDQVVLQFPGSPYRFRLVNENVRSFTVGDHRFVRLVADSASGSVIRTGFYEVLAEGSAQVLARRAKRLQEKKGQDFIDVELIPTDRLFVRKAGRYYPINNKNALLRLLADRTKDLQKYVQTHKLKFSKKHLEASTVELASYYNGLPPQ
ncbi:hypothetical protein MON38_14165 [Hymenobacter sp. DH14]|uniref:Uncharacterized protein n=1 Tax=Hymenobacter cyanobacteriorum TaxID=2926463 RepID=A0A9X2AFV3_9BACT|nr:hypothetical protein [Hymenobacter cyanobacteriorum]MCI1188571.1 hypothetical protein [Hymenobacter cyanobacteriorum]